MATNVICIWAADADVAILLDRRSCLQAQPHTRRTVAQGARLVVVSFLDRLAEDDALLSTHTIQPRREVLSWPRLFPTDTPFIIGPSALAAVSVHDFEIFSPQGQSKEPADLTVATDFILDRTLTLDAAPDGWWVVSQLTAYPPGRYDFHAATVIESSRLGMGGVPELNPDGDKPLSLVERLVGAAEADQDVAFSPAVFWIAPFKGDRVGPAVMVEAVTSDPAVQVAVAFEPTKRGDLQPTLRLTCRQGIRLADVATHLQAVHWRRSAAAFGREDLVLKDVECPTSASGKIHEVVMHFDDPVRHGDVFGLISPYQLVGIATGAEHDTSPAASADPLERCRALFVRRERFAEPVASDETLTAMNVTQRLAGLTFPRRGTELGRLMGAWAARIERIAVGTTYLLPASIGAGARSSLHQAINGPAARPDRVLHAALVPHRLERLVRAGSLPRPAPVLVPVATPLNDALAETMWDNAFAESPPVDRSLLNGAGPGRSALLRCLLDPTTHFAAASSINR